MDNFLRASLRRVGTCLVLLSAALMGCTSAWGRSIEVPDELREHASVYDATAEHQSFDAQAPRQRVTFELKEGRETNCARVFSVKGELGRSSVAVEQEDGTKTVVARSVDHLSAGSKEGAPLVLHATFERVRAEAGETWAESEVGEGAFSVGGKPAGTFHSEAGVIEVSLMAPSGEATDYLIIAQSYRRQYVIKSQGRTLLYAEVDWSHWGFGERGFQVVVADGLTCDQHENVIDLFLFAKVLSGA